MEETQKQVLKNTKQHIIPIVFSLLAIVLFLIGLFLVFNNFFSRPKSLQPEEIVTITLDRTGFSPQVTTIAPGTRIVWENTSGKEATVNSDPHPTHNLYSILQLGNFDTGETLQVVFDKTGTYTYHNHFDPSQKGTVIVK